MTYGIRITGVDRKRFDLEQFKRDVSGLKDAWEKISILAANAVRRYTPVDSGDLLRTTEPKADRGFASVRSGNDTDVPYAAIVNYKYGKRYMQKADIEVQPMIEPILLAEIDKAILRRRL